MLPRLLTRILLPARFKRQEMARQIKLLRGRDGDQCTRCRRPLRFDLPPGHDRAPRLEPLPTAGEAPVGLNALCLTHVRCTAGNNDGTAEVRERARIKHEIALFDRAREQRRA